MGDDYDFTADMDDDTTFAKTLKLRFGASYTLELH